MWWAKEVGRGSDVSGVGKLGDELSLSCEEVSCEEKAVAETSPSILDKGTCVSVGRHETLGVIALGGLVVQVASREVGVWREVGPLGDKERVDMMGEEASLICVLWQGKVGNCELVLSREHVGKEV
ncbi:uncharacterized protein G2W53_029037 [Senna tora]|uniref:Uncharacterized protein n=1 Tax=Senna tora TaxID=362788 RepID=A0A834T4J1_9FABA|nr:uncharacterized protein G2W53_029037 [Senna tora]